MSRCRQRKCCHCQQLYKPDPRNLWHQEYCSQPSCRKASKAASQRRWRRTPEGRDYFRGSGNVDRVRDWRKDHPGYWRKQCEKPAPLQDVLFAQPIAPSRVDLILNDSDLFDSAFFPAGFPSTAADFGAPKLAALQDVMSAQAALMLGLIAQLSGALRDDIAPHARRLFHEGRLLQTQGLAGGARHERGQTSAVSTAPAQSSNAVQLDRSPADSG